MLTDTKFLASQATMAWDARQIVGNLKISICQTRLTNIFVQI